MIVTLGNFATKLLLDTKEGITRSAVASSRIGDGCVTLIPTLHPAAVLRGGGTALAQTRADFVLAKRAIARTQAAPGRE